MSRQKKKTDKPRLRVDAYQLALLAAILDVSNAIVFAAPDTKHCMPSQADVIDEALTLLENADTAAADANAAYEEGERERLCDEAQKDKDGVGDGASG